MYKKIIDSELMWEWEKKPTPLNRLDDGQLLAIRKTLTTSKNKEWFKVSSEVWLKQVNYLIKKKSRKNVEELSNQIIGRRLKKKLPEAELAATAIYNLILKSMSKS